MNVLAPAIFCFGVCCCAMYNVVGDDDSDLLGVVGVIQSNDGTDDAVEVVMVVSVPSMRIVASLVAAVVIGITADAASSWLTGVVKITLPASISTAAFVAMDSITSRRLMREGSGCSGGVGTENRKSCG